MPKKQHKGTSKLLSVSVVKKSPPAAPACLCAEPPEFPEYKDTASLSENMGLLLVRGRGERIIIRADDLVSDDEILKAIRGSGVVITVVDFHSPAIKKGNNDRKSKVNIAIKADKSLLISREEVINRAIIKDGDALGNFQPEDNSEWA